MNPVYCATCERYGDHLTGQHVDGIDDVLKDWTGGPDAVKWEAATGEGTRALLREPPAGPLVRGADVERLRIACVECVDAWSLLLRQVGGKAVHSIAAVTRRLLGGDR